MPNEAKLVETTMVRSNLDVLLSYSVVFEIGGGALLRWFEKEAL
ncbi:hypothetical protein ACFL0M_13125 [Thermodesulfobacteriota bacterium]